MIKYVAIVGVVWCALVAACFVGLSRYQSRPGAGSTSPSAWPALSAITRDGRPTLVMFAHPLCPCTRASLTELERLMQRLTGGVAAYVLFEVPSDANEAWRESELWEKARGIAGVHALPDLDGREAMRFGALTSGQVVFYDRGGALRFRGGITVARGHEGASPGGDRILALAGGRPPERDDAPVFGCSLIEHEVNVASIGDRP